MLKTIAFPLIAMMLIFSILAPSLMPLLSDKCDIVVLMDTAEEEKKKEKESEKKFDEKDLFLNQNIASSNFFALRKAFDPSRYLFSNSDFRPEIHLPPPKKLM